MTCSEAAERNRDSRLRMGFGILMRGEDGSAQWTRHRRRLALLDPTYELERGSTTAITGHGLEWAKDEVIRWASSLDQVRRIISRAERQDTEAAAQRRSREGVERALEALGARPVIEPDPDDPVAAALENTLRLIRKYGRRRSGVRVTHPR